ncbi:MAG TPA: MlaD family protein [bacterium]|jgi:phospholipid/cholesterol/gamma-HCH transport system substrate-binding protein
MKISAAAKVGFTAIIISAVMVVLLKGLGLLSITPPGGYYLTVSFESVKGLNPGADVQLNGNPVGEVEEMVNDSSGNVTVKIYIKRNHVIHEHANFSISRESIFGTFLITITELRSGRLLGPIEGGLYPLEVPKGSCIAGGPVYLKNSISGEVTTVGEIVQVNNRDNYNDRADVKITDPDLLISEQLAFAQYQPDAQSQSGLIIYYPLKPNDHVTGIREAGPEDIVPQAAVALENVTAQAGEIMDNLNAVLIKVNLLLDTEKITENIDSLMAEVTSIANNIRNLTANLDSTVQESSPYILATLQNVESMTDTAKDLVEGLEKYDDPELNQNVKDLIQNLTDSSETLAAILEDIQVYSSDDELRDDITGSIHETRAAIQEARDTMETLNEAIGSASDSLSEFGGIETGADFTLRYNEAADEARGDFDFWVGTDTSEYFFKAGISDIGQTERANLQIGYKLDHSTSSRAGIYRGKLGVGLDWRSDAVSFMTDLYDPNNLTWDVYGGYAVLPELDLLIGVEDFLEEDEVNFGFQYHF